jgi:hypothetical protein
MRQGHATLPCPGVRRAPTRPRTGARPRVASMSRCNQCDAHVPGCRRPAAGHVRFAPRRGCRNVGAQVARRTRGARCPREGRFCPGRMCRTKALGARENARHCRVVRRACLTCGRAATAGSHRSKVGAGPAQRVAPTISTRITEAAPRLRADVPTPVSVDEARHGCAAEGDRDTHPP